MKKIVVAQPLEMYEDQKERLNSLGDVIFYDDLTSTSEEWLERVQGADVICSNKKGPGLKENIHNLKDVFISVPFVGTSWADEKILKENNVILQKCPGCNKEPVAEWIVGMMINLLRRLPRTINSETVYEGTTKSLAGKRVCICGPGNVGTLVGEICEALHMEVTFFVKGDNLIEMTKGADVIVDTLSGNEETFGIYDDKFFESLKPESYFVSVTSQKLWDAEAMLKALDDDILDGVAVDMGGIQSGDTTHALYQRLSKHPKVLATPHMASNNDRKNRICNDMMIDNIEKYLKEHSK